MSTVSDLRKNVDSILGIRDDIGADLRQVFLVTRTWSGSELGDGAPTEHKTRMLPSPRIVEYTHDLRINEGGAVQQGDISLKMISRQTYPEQNQVDGTVTAKNIEKFYEVGGKIYRVVGVTTKHLTWNVLLRPLSDQKRY